MRQYSVTTGRPSAWNLTMRLTVSAVIISSGVQVHCEIAAHVDLARGGGGRHSVHRRSFPCSPAFFAAGGARIPRLASSWPGPGLAGDTGALAVGQDQLAERRPERPAAGADVAGH